ncbi:hypothetical protein AKJ09_00364 [Labilithrix luteola]|uniref:Glycosyltransferase RgtA/B/C/D-like domain-containing protein n=1 Tax=Labilithrix luteola TaxID=1391654 RepID=A0A0K1PJJ5_9BACT|nr:hypothetical protein AKJ09_00364 [Labilithrix luteola]
MLRRVVAPLLVALIPFFWVCDATNRSSLATVGRDQGIFQYVAWAVLRGDVDYRDIRDVNGPLVHLLHVVMLVLGGGDEHRFHVLELLATGISFAVAGACLPGLVSKRTPSPVTRLAWALAGWVVLSGQYHLYTYWNQAQRESFCDWFLLPSLALQLLPPARTKQRASLRIVGIAALSTITWFGKPSFLPFTVAQLIVLLLERDDVLSRSARFGRFVLGGLLGAVVPMAYLLRYGDAATFIRISLLDVPQVYRFIWAKSVPEIFGEEGPLGDATLGVACAVLVTSLVAVRELPKRALVVPLGIGAGLCNVIAQHKGFGYHFHPLTALTALGWLMVVVMIAERFEGAPRKRPLGRYFSLGIATALGLFVASNMKNSPHTRNVWILGGGETAERRADPEYFATFRNHDFFPWEMRQAAQYIASHTSPDARVQVYGMDPYLLFLAERKSATPYIYAYDLNADAALDGGWKNRPTDAQRARIRGIRHDHEHDMLRKLKANPPEVFVFIDRSPLITFQDAWEDFRYACPDSAAWVGANYHPARAFGEFHVWIHDGSKNPDVEAPYATPWSEGATDGTL